jgi:hypothetical protein
MPQHNNAHQLHVAKTRQVNNGMFQMQANLKLESRHLRQKLLQYTEALLWAAQHQR